MLRWMITLVCVSVAVAQEWELVWSDEFDGPEIDDTKWTAITSAAGFGNGEFQVYTPDKNNTYIENGMLHIAPTKLADNINPKTGEPFGEDFLVNGVLDLEEIAVKVEDSVLMSSFVTDLYGDCLQDEVEEWRGCYREGGEIPPMASGRIYSSEKFSMRYGRAEIRAKMPVGDWLWPALWLLPDKWYYGDWPASGEIDMTECIGNRDYECDYGPRDINHMGSTLHWGIDRFNNKFPLTTAGVENYDENFGDYFHLYRLDWTPEGMEFYLDDEKLLTIPEGKLIDDDDRAPDDCFTGFYDFGEPWNGDHNPWTQDLTCDQFMAPFDQDFHFIINVAVGGTNYYIPDDCVNAGGAEGREKPWRNGVTQEEGMWQFYDAQDAWYPTWTDEGDNFAMKVDYVRVYQPQGGFQRTQVPEGCPIPPGPDICPPAAP